MKYVRCSCGMYYDRIQRGDCPYCPGSRRLSYIKAALIVAGFTLIILLATFE